MNPQNLIMIVSLIIRCIMRLLGFQCTACFQLHTYFRDEEATYFPKYCSFTRLALATYYLLTYLLALPDGVRVCVRMLSPLPWKLAQCDNLSVAGS